MSLAWVVLTLLLQAPVPIADHEEEAAPRTLPVPPLGEATEQDRAHGGRHYQTHCASCHGLRGEGGRGPTLAASALPRATDDATLVRILSRGIPGTDMPRTRLERDEIWQVAAYVKSLGQRNPEPLRGDAQRGEQLYATKGGCALCHSIRGRGGALGPDLTAIGLRRGAAHLRRSLTDPGAEVPRSFRSDPRENFLQVRAVTRAGRELPGVRVNEDPFTLQMRDISGRLHSFDKKDLRALHKEWGKSSMPAYGSTFTADELDDLVAYLASLQGR